MNKYVEIFPWNDNFDTGINEIDVQHKKLVELLNQLSSHLAYQFKSPTMDEVFNELTAYAIHHFNSEEAIWQKYFTDDAWYTAHQKTHTTFIDDILAIKANVNGASYNEVMEKIVSFLTSWLVFHIIETDKCMAKVVLAIQNGSSLIEAKKQVNEDFDDAIKALIKSVLGMHQNLSGKTLDLIKEINERKKVESKLRLASNAINSTMESIVITDANLRITDANPAFCKVMAVTLSDILSENLCRLKPSMNDPQQSTAMWATLQECGNWGGEIYERKQSGELEPEWLTVSVIKNEHDEISHYVAIFSSISELIKRQQMLEKIANHDPLTGLPNRRLLTDRLNQAMLYATRNRTLLAVCYLDLDGFKQVNDVFGHAAGDQLLQETAHRLKSAVRCNDTVCRLGGDEFVLLLNEWHKREDVAVVLDKVLAIIQLPVELETSQAHVSASIGVSFFADDSDDANQLLLYADQAMYRAKQQGKSQYCGVYLI